MKIIDQLTPIVKLISGTICCFLSETCGIICNKISDIVLRFFHIKRHDDAKLFLTNYKVALSNHAWTLHKALLKGAYERTHDANLQERIAFLSTNYLATAAPVYIDLMKLFFSNIEPFFQLNPVENFYYHRYGFMSNLKTGDKINDFLAMSQESPFIPTDTSEFEEFLPLNFTLLNLANQRDWKEIVKIKIRSHITAAPKNSLKKPLNVKFLFDLTNSLKEPIQFKKGEEKFKRKFKEHKAAIEQIYKEVCQELTREYPQFSEKELKTFCHINSMAICRLYLKEKKVSGVKILPLFASLQGNKLYKVHPEFLNFLSQTGLFIGAIHLRRYLRDSFRQGEGVDYAVKGGNRDVMIYKDKDSFMNLNLIKGFFEKLIKNVFSPEVDALMRPILLMLQGLFKENINEETWNFLNEQGAKREIFQNTLFKLKEHLATAELHGVNNFSLFSKAMELSFAELAVLLELIRPYNKGDFAKIYKENLKIIPKSLQKHVITGLGRTAMNLFSAVNVALQQTGYSKERVFYGEGFYFEQADFIGKGHTIDTVLTDPQKAKKTALYAAQFNPNIGIKTDYTHYKIDPVAQNIKALLKERTSEDPSLTVALDCTIDYINSPKVKQLLKEFEKETNEGKLQFFLFKSGQKLEMFGTDAYYGAPFVLINNGDQKWDAFKRIFLSEGIQTDSLTEQWFCLSHKYALKELETYRNLIFTNTRNILNNIPKDFQPHSNNLKNQSIVISSVDPNIDACFLDIKLKGKLHKARAGILQGYFYRKCIEHGIKAHSRGSFGFSHLNFLIIMNQEASDSTTIRLTCGINPKENNFIINFFQELAEKKPIFIN